MIAPITGIPKDMGGGVGGIAKEALPALLVSALFALVPGYFLSVFVQQIAGVPGLLTLVPAVIGMRGNVFGSFCGHLSSLRHLQAQTMPFFDVHSVSFRDTPLVWLFFSTTCGS